MNWYLITNIVAALGVVMILIASLAIEKFSWRKISTKHVVIIALFIAINVLLTNLLSYNLPIIPGGVNIALGDWILFLLGAIFGPLVGWIGAVTADSLGAIINVGGAYHAGFMFDKTILAFSGSMIFIFKKNNLITLKVILFYAISLAFESLLFNPIWLYASGWGNAVFINMVGKIIKYPIVLFCYVSFVLVSLAALNPILIRWQSNTFVWCLRNGLFWQISKKQNKQDKINLDEKGNTTYE
jgi:thiamine transporter